MVCEFYCRCGCCARYENCPYDYYGDGSPWCGKFLCNKDDCDRENCISDEEFLEE